MNTAVVQVTGALSLLVLFVVNGCGDGSGRRQNVSRDLYCAAMDGDLEKAQERIAEGADVNAMGPHRRATPLGIAAKQGNVDMVRLLLANGADTSIGSIPPLALAAGRGHERVMRLLLAAGADPNQPEGGEAPTALLAAARYGRLDGIKLLVSHGMRVPARYSEEESSPLWVAASNGHVAVVRYLLGKGLDPSLVDSDGRQPLHMAAMEGHRDVVEALLNAGVRPERRTRNGLTAADMAMQAGHVESARLIRERAE